MSDPDDPAAELYGTLLQALQQDGLPFLVGGAYAFAHYTGIRRPTKDLDLFIRAADWPRLQALAARIGYRCELTFAHWLGKVYGGEAFVDVIFNSGNGLSPVDEAWFAHAAEATILGRSVHLAPVEESLWTKAFIMERERYDGADVAHLLHACAGRIDWARLASRFGSHWRVLLSHLVLFGFIYPAERGAVPAWLMEDLLGRLLAETRGAPPQTGVCNGPLLSRAQYLPDISHRGYEDVRLSDATTMTEADVAVWTAAINPGSG
jgi:hypothetical protein